MTFGEMRFFVRSPDAKKKAEACCGKHFANVSRGSLHFDFMKYAVYGNSYLQKSAVQDACFSSCSALFLLAWK